MIDRNARYLNPELPTAERVADLMGRMTLEEKVGQVCQYLLPHEDIALAEMPDGPEDDLDDSTMHYRARDL